MRGEGNGNPLQYSCLENPVDRGTWWAAVHRVTHSRTWLRWLSTYACIGEGNGNPLQCSCLENPRDRGAWWAAIYGVSQSQIQLKRLSSSSSSSTGEIHASFKDRNVASKPSDFFFWRCCTACGILVPLIRDQTCTLCIGGTKSQPLDCQGSPEPSDFELAKMILIVDVLLFL